MVLAIFFFLGDGFLGAGRAVRWINFSAPCSPLADRRSHRGAGGVGRGAAPHRRGAAGAGHRFESYCGCQNQWDPILG